MSYKQALCEPRGHKHRVSYFSRIPTTPAVFAAALLILLAGCGPRDDRYNPSRNFHLSGAIAPPQVVAPDPLASGSVDGVYLERADDPVTSLCCWIANRASVAVKKSRPSDALVLHVYVAKVPAFEAHPQKIAVTFQGNPQRTVFAGLSPGFHELHVSVPKDLRRSRGPLRVNLDCAVTYTPSPNAKIRYGVVLTSIYFS